MNAPRHLISIDEFNAKDARFDAIIDARSPAEFAEDHIPGAINCPVLDNAQRAQVGTLYVQVSAFDARKLGAALVFRNIARHVETLMHDKPKDWRPLVYCWRGGQRSGAFTWALRQIGWDAGQLVGGYKSFRRSVIDSLNALPARYRFHVIAGPTGSGKTLLLQALAREGAQVLDLEALARHRGSVLGGLPGIEQPTQKWFETTLYEALHQLDPARAVFVEAESRKIGRIQIPETLLSAMRASPCVIIQVTPAARHAYLLRDYAHLGHTPTELQAKLHALKELHSKERFTRWLGLAENRELPQLFAELTEHHYDPLYKRSQGRNFAAMENAICVMLEDLDDTSLRRAARELMSKTE